MGLAKAKLTKELTVRQLVRDLAVEWGDDEADVCRYLAGLIVNSGLRFYHHHWAHYETGAEKGRIQNVALLKGGEPGFSTDGTGPVSVGLAKVAKYEWDRTQVTVLFPAPDENSRPVERIIPFGEIVVRKKQFISFLRAKSLPIPPAWIEGAPQPLKTANTAASAISLEKESSESRREVRKHETLKRYEAWQDQINELARDYPLKNHSSLCKLLAKEQIAEDADWQTIRRKTRSPRS